jgi:hypothetical protein
MSLVVRWFGLLSAAAVALSACKREAPPAGEDARAPTSPAADPAPAAPASAEETQPAAVQASAASVPGTAPAMAAPAAGSSRYDEAKFAVEAKPSGSYAAGKEASFDIVLDAKPPFHVNQQYPYKFKTKEGPGVKFSQAVVGKDAAKLETQRVTMRVPFTPDGAGKRTVNGQFAFSVCTDETCLMEKRDLSLVVDVK